METRAKIIAALLGLFVVLPIWFYLLYQVLVRVQASELMWFLFWVYVPVSLFVAVLGRIFDDKK